jgi:formate dehydrogenase subunit gamma
VTPARAVSDKVARHALIDRVGHWLMAACVLTLLATSFLPILGVQFAWVTIHWATGLVLTAAVLVHTVRSLIWKSVRTMLLGAADARDVMSVASFNLRRTDAPPRKPGKYSPAQKLIHHAFAVTVLTTIVTGILMMLKVDTPFWRRDPGIFANSTWGIIHVLHGLAALLLITMVMSHVYFALRPEKLLYFRAMWRGWITRGEFRAHHDPQRWQVDE